MQRAPASSAPMRMYRTGLPVLASRWGSTSSVGAASAALLPAGFFCFSSASLLPPAGRHFPAPPPGTPHPAAAVFPPAPGGPSPAPAALRRAPPYRGYCSGYSNRPTGRHPARERAPQYSRYYSRQYSRRHSLRRPPYRCRCCLRWVPAAAPPAGLAPGQEETPEKAPEKARRAALTQACHLGQPRR